MDRTGVRPTAATPKKVSFVKENMDRSVNRETATELLRKTSRGSIEASEQLQTVVYEELRRLARAFMRRERRDHTLQPTALVHEAYARLIDQRDIDWHNRTRFLGLAAVMMRRVLINHARDRIAAKRGGGAQRVSLTSVDDASRGPAVEIVALHEALEKLAHIDPRKARIVELKFFGGLTTSEISEAIAVSTATVEREWMFSRAWLYNAIAGGPFRE